MGSPFRSLRREDTSKMKRRKMGCWSLFFLGLMVTGPLAQAARLDKPHGQQQQNHRLVKRQARQSDFLGTVIDLAIKHGPTIFDYVVNSGFFGGGDSRPAPSQSTDKIDEVDDPFSTQN